MKRHRNKYATAPVMAYVLHLSYLPMSAIRLGRRGH